MLKKKKIIILLKSINVIIIMMLNIIFKWICYRFYIKLIIYLMNYCVLGLMRAMKCMGDNCVEVFIGFFI